MTAVDVSYNEMTESARVAAVPLGHLSVETGRLYLEDFADGDRKITHQLEQVAPWLEAATKRTRKRFGRNARISTCFLVDDYSPSGAVDDQPKPSEVVDIVTTAADQAGFKIDYLAREAGCAVAYERPYSGPRDQSALADIVAGLIVEEAAVGANGSRPPTAQTGWLSNGERSPAVSVAMDAPQWEPPEEFGKYRHSVFVDIELWSLDHYQQSAKRQYSCSLLSAVWQLLRLGLLRDAGDAVAKPYRFGAGEGFPDLWQQLPSITQLTPDAAPFAAYQALSVLPPHFRAAEHAAEIIVDHLRFDKTVLKQTADRARDETNAVTLPDNPAGRLSHLFFNDVHVALND
ncbi:SCO2522 family protein [Catenulispora pinisilvae]|uniref:SCO2522 family protein n=1 Tax=Catenulispora pinisilvae TaxID=2705253 RepID=UPI002B2729E9|nr:SCO2522 family protein [Catenulispora pinisilvae]